MTTGLIIYRAAVVVLLAATVYFLALIRAELGRSVKVHFNPNSVRRQHLKERAHVIV